MAMEHHIERRGNPNGTFADRAFQRIHRDIVGHQQPLEADRLAHDLLGDDARGRCRGARKRRLDCGQVAAIQRAADQLGYPVFVKPARGGSSRGTTKVKSAAEFGAALVEAHRFDTKALVEQEIRGFEIECAVLEINGEAKASLVGQIKIDAKHEFYDFEAKYLDGATTIELPAPIDQKVSDEIRAKAIEAFISLGCSGLARVDFFLTPNNEIIINELNTMPGFTATSVFPKMWEATGVSYSQTVTHLLQAALSRNNGVLGN